MVLVRGAGVFGVFIRPLDAHLSSHWCELGAHIRTPAVRGCAEHSRPRLDGTNITTWSFSWHEIF